jgi:hypothetical protein
MKKDLCSITIAKALDELGFNRETRYCYDPRVSKIKRDPNKQVRDWNHYLRPPLFYVSVPTVDQAIDWIREKYDVIVFNHVAPYVDPRDKKNRIAYIYNVKYCNRKNGWNGRVHISYGKCASYNIYAAKRMAIMEAIRWIKKNRICSKKTKK